MTAAWLLCERSKILCPIKRKFMLFTWLCAILFAQCQSATPESSSPIPEELLSKLPDSIVHSNRFSDTAGEHVLALVREHKISPDGKETIFLKVFQFVQNGTSWVQEWIIKDWIECQNLDIEGDFFSNSFHYLTWTATEYLRQPLLTQRFALVV